MAAMPTPRGPEGLIEVATGGAPPTPPSLPSDPLPDALVARTIRRRVGVAAALWALVSGGLVWMKWDGSMQRIAVPVAGAAYLFILLAKVALNPLRYPHLARRSPLQRVLDAGGVPEELWAGASTPAERSVVIRDLMDELGDQAEGFWHSRLGMSVGRVLGGLGTTAWLAAAGVALFFDGWTSAAICLAGSLVFALPLAWGMRDERRRARAIELLRVQAGQGLEGDGSPLPNRDR